MDITGRVLKAVTSLFDHYVHRNVPNATITQILGWLHISVDHSQSMDVLQSTRYLPGPVYHVVVPVFVFMVVIQDCKVIRGAILSITSHK